MAKITVQESIDRLKRHFDDTLGEIDNDLYYDWLNDLNFMIYRELYNANPESLIDEHSIVTTGATSYPLPSDFKNVNPVGCGVYNDTNNVPVPMQKYGSSINGYYISGNANLNLTGDFASGVSITLRYIPSISKLSNLSDELVINYEDMLAVLNWMDKNYGRWNLDLIRENNSDARFTRSLVELIDNYKTEPTLMML